MRTRLEPARAGGLMTRRNLFAVLGGAVVAGGAPKLQAGYLPATEVTQILNNIQLIASYIKQAASLVSEVNQEQMMITNLAHNGFHSLSDFSSFLTTASGLVQGGLAIAYSTAQMDLAFQRQFPGYTTFDHTNSWAQNYVNWAQANRDTISGTMRMLNLSAADLQSSQALAAAMRTHASGAAGAQQILETMGEFSSAQLNELQGLRSLMLADQQSKLSYMAVDQQQKDTAAAAQQKFFAPGLPTPDTRIYDPVQGVH